MKFEEIFYYWHHFEAYISSKQKIEIMRPRINNNTHKHELVYSTAERFAGSRDGQAGNRPARRIEQGSRQGGAGNVQKQKKME